MNRRRLLTRLGVVLLSLAVASCGGGQRGASRPRHPLPEEPFVFTGTPGVYGGRVVVSCLGPPKTFNVMVSDETSTGDILSRLVFEGLTSFNNATQEVIPGLAASWETSPDGTVWTFHLRRGLRWSDGAPLTADDVMFSGRVALDPKIHPSVYDLLMVDGKLPVFEKVDATTVRITLPRPYGPFIHVISGMRVMPKHKLEAALDAGKFETTWGLDTPPDSIVGNGPFRVAGYVPNQTVVLKPNPWYYRIDTRKQRLPYVDELVWVIVPDQNADLVRFKSGETDAIYVRPEDVQPLKDGETAGHYSLFDLGPEFGSNMLWFNQNAGKNDKGKAFVDPVKLAWFRNDQFRLAVAHAVDRETIIRNVYYGQAEPLYGPIPTANKAWFNPGITRYPYDLDKARAILAAAGFKDRNGDGILEDPDGNTVSFVVNTNSNSKERVAIGQIIVEDLKKIGLDARLAPIEFQTLIASIRDGYNYDAVLLGATGGVPPDPIMMANSFRSSGRTHYWWPKQASPSTPWEATVDSLYNAQLGLNDVAARKPYMDQIQEIYAREVPSIYTVSRKGFVAIRDRLKNVRPSIFRPWAAWNADEIFIDPQAGAPGTSR